MTSRAEHLAWAKARALEYVDRGELNQAFSSIVDDLSIHEELADHSELMNGAMLMEGRFLNTPATMREFIEGLR